MILLTGASGIIGREVFSTLRTHYEIKKLGRKSQADIQLNLAKPGLDLTHLVSCPDFVIHLAAAVPGAHGIKDDDTSAKTTLLIDKCIYNACRLWQCPVIYASGCSLYQSKGSKEVQETDAIQKNFQSPYLHSKAIGDATFSSLDHCVIIRISCPVGKGLSPACVIGQFVTQLNTKQKITVYGTGTREQDFIDVRDIASAIEKIVNNFFPDVYNIAAGYPTSMRKLADRIIEIKGFGQALFGSKIDPFEGVQARYSIQNAFNKLQWQPKYELSSMLRDHEICR
jgi:nucleoside-diphosphate-sugar epimerase